MDDTARENLLFLLVAFSIVVGVVSIALATIAITAIRELLRTERKTAQVETSKEIIISSRGPQGVLRFDTPTEELKREPHQVKRSPLLASNRRLVDDFWG